MAQHRARPSARVRRRRSAAVVLVLVLVISLATWATVSHTSGTAATSTTTTLPATTTSTSTTTTTPPVTTTTSDQGVLPQTATQPDSSPSAVTARFSPLFTAIRRGDTEAAMSVFFPRSAYVGMKTGRITSPSSDYADRLVAFYRLDLEAYRAELGAQPRLATLVAVNANPGYAQYIPAGVCENNVGYWHLPGVRFVYRVSGVENSFAIASLISWRGVWYVVHLGPNPRSENVGLVDQPSLGPGVPGPAGGC